MKLTVCMKTPDALDYAIAEAAELEEDAGSGDTIDVDAVRDICGKWFKYGEVVQLEIDTDAMTCEVMSL